MQQLRILSICALTLFSLNQVQAADVDTAEESQIRVAIKALSDSYAVYRDNNDHEGYANTFTEDGELILYGNTTKGREAIRSKAANASDNVRMHVMTTSLIDVIDSHNATGVHYATVFSVAKPEDHKDGDAVIAPNYSVMGKYHDKYSLTDEGWKIAERRLDVIFRATE